MIVDPKQQNSSKRHGSINSENPSSGSGQPHNMSMEAKPFCPKGIRSLPISDTNSNNSNPSPRRLIQVAQ